MDFLIIIVFNKMSGYDLAVKNKLALVLPPTLDKIQVLYDQLVTKSCTCTVYDIPFIFVNI